MIQKITINYENKYHPDGYTHLIKDNDGNNRQLLPKEVVFDKGLNIIIGENGCGKSTLLNLLTDLTLARGLSNGFDFWSQVKLFYPTEKELFTIDYRTKQDVVRIYNDYHSPVSRMDTLSGKMKLNYGQLNSADDFRQYISERTLSKGQQMISGIKWSIGAMLEKAKTYTLDSLIPDSLMKSCNDTWSNGYKGIKTTILETHQDGLEKRPVFLMDEPDEGLDINNLKQLKDFLLIASATTQVIVILHNQLLIKSLADKANVIELSEDYLNKINEI